MSTIKNKLDSIRAIIQAKGFPLEQFLKPGLPQAEINARLSQLPFQLPDELQELYQWHDGTDSDCDFPLFKDQVFLSLKAALRAYEQIQTSVRSKQNGSASAIDLHLCFPFASLEGAYYVLPANSQTLAPALERPVIRVGEQLEVDFASFTAMLDTIADWFSQGAHRVDELTVDQKLEQEIWQKYNSGIFANP